FSIATLAPHLNSSDGQTVLFNSTDNSTTFAGADIPATNIRITNPESTGSDDRSIKISNPSTIVHVNPNQNAIFDLANSIKIVPPTSIDAVKVITNYTGVPISITSTDKPSQLPTNLVSVPPVVQISHDKELAPKAEAKHQ